MTEGDLAREHHHPRVPSSLGSNQAHAGAEPGGSRDVALSAMPDAVESGPQVDNAMTRVLVGLDEGVLRPSRPDLAPLVNWGGGGGLPIHRWHRYREGSRQHSSRELRLGQRILDPFCGSGSIMVGAARTDKIGGRDPRQPPSRFRRQGQAHPTRGERGGSRCTIPCIVRPRMERVVAWPTPALRIADKVFEPEVLDAVLRLRGLIESRGDEQPRVRDFLFLAWLSILQDVGSYFKEGNGIKYRNRKRLENGLCRVPRGAVATRTVRSRPGRLCAHYLQGEARGDDCGCARVEIR